MVVGLTPTVPTQLAVTGTFYDADGNTSTLLTAKLSSVGGCSVGSEVDFYVDLDGNGSFEQFVGSGTTDGTGAASTVWSGSSWRTGSSTCRRCLQALPAAFRPRRLRRSPSSPPATLPTAAGWYQFRTTGSPRVNYGFTVRKHSDGTYKGQLIWHNNGKWRIKGTLTWFGKTDPCTYNGIAGLKCGPPGRRQLYSWNNTTLTWDYVQDVSYVISFADGGSSKKSGAKPDSFGINVTNFSAPSLPESAPQQLKGGNVHLP